MIKRAILGKLEKRIGTQLREPWLTYQRPWKTYQSQRAIFRCDWHPRFVSRPIRDSRVRGGASSARTMTERMREPLRSTKQLPYEDTIV